MLTVKAPEDTRNRRLKGKGPPQEEPPQEEGEERRKKTTKATGSNRKGVSGIGDRVRA